MRKLKNILFSMELSGMLLLLFAAAIGFATFIENDFGTQTAKAKIYNATWFEFLLLLLAVNMTGSIFRYKMYLKHKWPVFMFHIAFLVIALGAAVTRFVGYEGMMNIREGNTNNTFVTDETYVRFWIDDGAAQAYEEEQVFATPADVEGVSEKLYTPAHEAEFEVLEYYIRAGETYTEGENGEPLIWLVVSDAMSGRQNVRLKQGQMRQVAGVTFAFDSKDAVSGMNFTLKDGNLYFLSADTVSYMNMMANTSEQLVPDSLHQFLPRALYGQAGVRVVLKEFYESAVTQLVSTESKSGSSGTDAILVRATVDGVSEDLQVFGGKGIIGETESLTINGVNVRVSYGAKSRTLPFSIQLVDFELERYPGSNSPSSYASDVIVIDEEKGLEMPYRIFMNNVLNYRGYRFFQSSYDKDELGTVLSVNHDAAGTIITYIGYLLMTLGMVFAIFVKQSRFKFLMKATGKLRQARKEAVTALLLVGLVGGSFLQANAQQSVSAATLPVIDEEHAADFGRLLVQDMDGRIKPVNTLASEVLRKIARKTKFEGMNPEQVFLGIMTYPDQWINVPFIKVAHPEINELLGVEGKLVPFSQIVNLQTGDYKLSQYVERAYAKKPAAQGKFDKEVIKVDERVNIFYMIYSGSFLKVFPIPNDENNKWVTSVSHSKFDNEEEALFVKGILSMYFSEIANAVQSGNWSGADEHFDYIRKFQEKYGSEVLPSESKIDLEIYYNEVNIFKRLAHYYLYIGFILIVLHFINILNPKINLKWVIRISSILVGVLFVLHTAGLALRWNISGHAPWSNGYESLIYIGWATILAGLIFVRRSEVTLAVTAMLASLILTVAGMSWMDPEITTLVPVLKSYWLIIHVAIITASYGFLALGALLGFFNLVLMNLKTKKNALRLNMTLTELNHVIEMTLIIGLFMLTIGTFLGGVWANESWGRYWGWDPKETWALVTVLVYSFVLHMRFIPGFRGNFSLSFASLISFGSVLMTYFGVNYYLSGLHSYAAGDPVPVPSFVYYTLIVIGVVGIMAYIADRKSNKEVEG